MWPNLFDSAISVTARRRDWMFSSVMSAFLPSKAGASMPPRASTPGWMLIVSYLQPSASAQAFASSRLSVLVYFDGIITHQTLSGPSASAAIAAVIAESMPPDMPSTTPGNLFLRT